MFVSRTRVIVALEYKIANDPYYKDVRVIPIALASFPLISTDISPLIPNVNRNDTLSHQQILSSTTRLPNSFEPYELQSSSFISTQTNARTEVEEVRQLLHIPNIPLPPSIDFPPIEMSPINEYNIEGLLSMAFPTLFPIGAAMLTQPYIHEVEMHEYALHLIHYHDNRFGKHPHFWYYINKVIMHHWSNSTASVRHS